MHIENDTKDKFNNSEFGRSLKVVDATFPPKSFKVKITHNAEELEQIKINYVNKEQPGIATT